jgi:hypothetical protein
LTSYLNGAGIDEIAEARRAMVEVILKELGASKSVTGPWEACARDYVKAKERWVSSEFWRAVECAADACRLA